MVDAAPVPGERRTQDISRRKLAIFSLLTAGLTLLVIAVLGETAARFWYTVHFIPDPPPPSSINPYQPNPYIVSLRPYLFFHIPGSRYFQSLSSDSNEYRINSMGFRGPEIDPSPLPGKKRLLVLGDSIVEGHGVGPDRTFTRHLDQKLAARGWEVVNVGVQGASPIYFAANLERYLFLQPDAVLIVVHENDLADDEMREKSYFDLPLLQDRAGLYSGGRIHSPAATSRLYALLENTWRSLFSTDLENIIARNAGAPGMHADQEADPNIRGFAVPPDRFDERWKMSSRYLSYARTIFRERRVEVLVSPLCTVTLVFPEVPSYADHCRNLEDHVEQWAREENVAYQSLVPTMRIAFDSHKITEVLLLNDFHPTVMTHGLLAETLYPFLFRHLPDPDPADPGSFTTEK